MEEIKVGEYIRSKDGDIAKIIEVKKSKRDCDTYYCTDRIMASGFYEHIKKHSPNIIDLIEEGDYVNGYRVKEVGIYTEKDVVDIYAVCSNLNEIKHKLINKKWYVLDNIDLLPGRNCKNDSIKSIVTKEQFEQMKYIVGDESNVKD